MWVDSQGVCHTAALPDPAFLMSDRFRRDLDRLIASDLDAVEELVASEEETFFVQTSPAVAVAGGESEFEGAVPPPEILNGAVASTVDLRDLIQGVSVRWRLDIILALDDYLSA